MLKDLSPITQSFTELGVVLTILSIVLLLLFLYFRKLINQKSIVERQLDANKSLLDNIILELAKIKIDLAVITTVLGGGFRTRGKDDD